MTIYIYYQSITKKTAIIIKMHGCILGAGEKLYRLKPPYNLSKCINECDVLTDLWHCYYDLVRSER